MNNTALQQIHSTISERFFDSRFLAPVFRQNPRFSSDQVTKVRGIMSAVFSESDNSEIFSAAKLLATVEDGRAGIVPSLPIEEVGLYARSARDLLPNLDSLDGASSILFLVAGTKDTVAGRDVIFRFHLDMRVSPTVVNKQNLSILEFAFRENPSFWTSQSRAGSSPALAIEGKVDVPPAVFRHFLHLKEFRSKCCCKICSKWNQGSNYFESLNHWMRSNSERDEYLTLNGYEILHYLALGREEDAKNILRKKSSVNVTDFSGNTAGHLASSVDVLRLLA
jgi:hypothetical protein